MAETSTSFTCVFAGTDFMAAGAIMAISERGLSVPREISVVGYDNSSIASIISPPLTTVDQPKDDMGRIGVERLVALIEQENAHQSTDGSDRVFVLNPTLVVGRSTSRVSQERD
jgi:DNA-binding LacI/PurR family transcriptional regulator